MSKQKIQVRTYNLVRWGNRWKNSFAHQRAEMLRSIGVTSEEGLKLLAQKKWEELDLSIQDAFKYRLSDY